MTRIHGSYDRIVMTRERSSDKPQDKKRKRLYNLKDYGYNVVRAVNGESSQGQLRYLFDKAEQCRVYFGIDTTCQAKCALYLACILRTKPNQ